MATLAVLSVPTEEDGRVWTCSHLRLPLEDQHPIGLRRCVDLRRDRRRRSMALPALGEHARTAGARCTPLLLACIHPVMHHRNAESLVWIYDLTIPCSPRPGFAGRGIRSLHGARRRQAGVGYLRTPAQRRNADGWERSDPRSDDNSARSGFCALNRRQPTFVPNRRWHDELIWKHTRSAALE